MSIEEKEKSIEVKVVGGDNLKVSLKRISSIAGIETGSSVVRCRTGEEEIIITLEEFCKMSHHIMKGGYQGWQEAPKCVKEVVSYLCSKFL